MATARAGMRARASKSNAFVHICSDKELVAQSSRKGPLSDLTFAVKDSICVPGSPSTAASASLASYCSPFEATVVTLLKRSGAAMVGKTNMDEFGMGSLGLRSTFGPTRNVQVSSEAPVCTGGSSSGSASAVAEGLVDLALGTDTGGSTRLPAAFSGVFGFKPSYGLLSRHGVISYASSLDCVGLLSRDLRIVQSAFGILNQHDPKDPTSVPADNAARQQSFSQETRDSLVIGIPAELFPNDLHSSVRKDIESALSVLQAGNVILRPVSLGGIANALSAYYTIVLAEASSNLARFDGIQYGSASTSELASQEPSTFRRLALGKEVQKRLLLGTFALSTGSFESYFLRAQIARSRLSQRFNELFTTSHTAGGIDFLIHPVALSFPPEQRQQDFGSKTEYTSDILNVPASLAGLPSIAVPLRKHQAGPTALQLVGPWGSDYRLLHQTSSIVEMMNRS